MSAKDAASLAPNERSANGFGSHFRQACATTACTDGILYTSWLLRDMPTLREPQIGGRWANVDVSRHMAAALALAANLARDRGRGAQARLFTPAPSLALPGARGSRCGARSRPGRKSGLRGVQLTNVAGDPQRPWPSATRGRGALPQGGARLLRQAHSRRTPRADRAGMASPSQTRTCRSPRRSCRLPRTHTH